LFFDHLIVHCDRAKELVQEHYHLRSTSKITVIPHGHYLDKYPRDSSTQSGLEPLDTAEDNTVFAFFGQIRPYKQVPRLVETFREIDNDSSTLIVAGKPSTEKLQRTLVERAEDRQDIHTMLEFIPNREVAQYFETADVLVFPYRDILTSGSVILAMSFSRPVIAPSLGCLPELVEDGVTGFLYDSDDSDGLQQAMERALQADLEKMGEHAYETVESFDWDSIADQTTSVYES
jgi:beta-1,4-mannosyltransferase